MGGFWTVGGGGGLAGDAGGFLSVFRVLWPQLKCETHGLVFFLLWNFNGKCFPIGFWALKLDILSLIGMLLLIKLTRKLVFPLLISLRHILLTRKLLKLNHMKLPGLALNITILPILIPTNPRLHKLLILRLLTLLILIVYWGCDGVLVVQEQRTRFYVLFCYGRLGEVGLVLDYVYC